MSSLRYALRLMQTLSGMTVWAVDIYFQEFSFV